MATVIVPLIVVLIGLILFVAPKTNAEIKELGRLAFFVGLFWLVYLLLNHTVHL